MTYDDLFFGFEGQPLAKPFDVGRLRNVNEMVTFTGAQRDVADKVDVYFGTRRILLIPNSEPEAAIDRADRMRQHLISQFQWEVTA